MSDLPTLRLCLKFFEPSAEIVSMEGSFCLCERFSSGSSSGESNLKKLDRLAAITISALFCSCKKARMFSLFKKDPLQSLEAKRKKMLEEAMQTQRSGDLRLYATKMEMIDHLEKEIEVLRGTLGIRGAKGR